MIFQNCLKLHSPNSSWNYVWQFWNITLGIYAKCHYKSCYQAYTNFNLHVKLLVPDSKWMVTLNIVTTVYSCCLISRPYSCLFDNSLCFNLWITLVKILSNWPFVCSFWPCGSVVWYHLHKTRTCTQFPHHIDWSTNPFAPEPNVPCTACDVINFNFVILVQGK